MEKWKTIEDVPEYAVSDLGRVKRILPGEGGTFVGKVIKSRPNNTLGHYLVVHLRSKGKQFAKLVHILVAQAFIPNPKGLPEVNHLGENSDNRACRLEWRSKKGNTLYSVQTGRCGDGVSRRFSGKYRARYQLNNKSVYIGDFSTYEEALSARQRTVQLLPKVI